MKSPVAAEIQCLQSNGASRLAPVRADSLGQHVFERIRDAIFSGAIQPAEPLRELQLAKSMGVSQSTVRDALGLLENVGLVVRQQNRSTTVTQLSDGEIRERLKIRVVLEELAMAEASQRANEEDLHQLQDLAGMIEHAISGGSHYETSQADLAFHRRVWTISGNLLLERTLHTTSLPLFAFFSVLQKNNLMRPAEAQPHGDLVEAIATGREDAARLAIRKHILMSYPFIESGTGAP